MNDISRWVWVKMSLIVLVNLGVLGWLVSPYVKPAGEGLYSVAERVASFSVEQAARIYHALPGWVDVMAFYLGVLKALVPDYLLEAMNCA